MLEGGTLSNTLYSGGGALVSVFSGYFNSKKNSKISAAKPIDINKIRSPFITVVQIALLYFKPENTKLIFIPNALDYQEEGVLTSFSRTWYYYFDPSAGAGKEYLTELKEEFILALKWFPVGSDEKLDEIYNVAKLGLVSLSKTYSGTHVTSFCKEIIVLIDDSFEEAVRKAEALKLAEMKKREEEERAAALLERTMGPETLQVGTPESNVIPPGESFIHEETEDNKKEKSIDPSEKFRISEENENSSLKLKDQTPKDNLEEEFELVKTDDSVPEKDLSKKIKALFDQRKINVIHDLFESAKRDRAEEKKESLKSTIRSIVVFIRGQVKELQGTITNHFENEAKLG